MIILGDIACPALNFSRIITEALNNAPFDKNQAILFNLEGLITDKYNIKDDKPVLFNHSSIINVFYNYKNKIAALANNHTLDLPLELKNTKKILSENGFLSVGAGSIDSIDFEEVVFEESGLQVHLINACWEFLLYHQNNKNKELSINTINEKKIIERVRQLKKENSISKIILYFHWSFDLEILPFPAYRQFSMDLIDNGASLIVGGHSHCVQGGESYKNGHIVYGLGNFFIPNSTYANGKLNFPAMSNLELVIEWSIKSNTILCHWFEYKYFEEKHVLKYIGHDNFCDSKTLKEHSPFASLKHKDYRRYFIKNRRKKLFIPVFNNYSNILENTIKMKLLKFRARMARKLAESGYIKWQN